MNILIVEDDTTTRLVLENLLTKWGFDVLSTASAEEAWEAVQSSESPPRLALVDWVLPGMDGLELMAMIRQAHGDRLPYLIMLSGRDRREQVAQCLEAGADDYITKPFHPAELRARINVGKRRLELEERRATEADERRATEAKDEHDALFSPARATRRN